MSTQELTFKARSKAWDCLESLNLISWVHPSFTALQLRVLLMVGTRPGINGIELATALGVNYITANAVMRQLAGVTSHTRIGLDPPLIVRIVPPERRSNEKSNYLTDDGLKLLSDVFS